MLRQSTEDDGSISLELPEDIVRRLQGLTADEYKKLTDAIEDRIIGLRMVLVLTLRLEEPARLYDLGGHVGDYRRSLSAPRS